MWARSPVREKAPEDVARYQVATGPVREDGPSTAAEVLGPAVGVTVNGVLTSGAASSVTGVNVPGGDGNDHLSVAESVAGEFVLPVTLSGGNGGDDLNGHGASPTRGCTSVSRSCVSTGAGRPGRAAVLTN